MHTLLYSLIFGVAYILIAFVAARVVKDNDKESDEERILRLTFSTLWPILLIMLGTFLLGEIAFVVHGFARKIRGLHTIHTNSYAKGDLDDIMAKSLNDKESNP